MTRKFLSLILALAICLSVCILPTRAMGDPSEWCGTVETVAPSVTATPEITAVPVATARPTPSPEPTIDCGASLPVISDGVYGDFEYQIYSYYYGTSKYCYITGYTGTSELVQIPSLIEGVEVGFIEAGSFTDCKTMKYLVIPETVGRVYGDAFKDCSNLETVYIPESLKLSTNSFEGCVNLKTIYYAGGDLQFTSWVNKDNISPELSGAELIPYQDSMEIFYYLNENTTSEGLVSDFSSMYEYSVTGVDDSDEIIGTGVPLTLNNITVNQSVGIKPVVLGDINGDGKVATADYMYIKSAILKTKTLSDAEFIAADINGDGELTAADYMKVKAHFVGSYYLHENI